MSKNIDVASQKLSLWIGLSIYSKNLVFAAKNLVSEQKQSFQSETLVLHPPELTLCSRTNILVQKPSLWMQKLSFWAKTKFLTVTYVLYLSSIITPVHIHSILVCILRPGPRYKTVVPNLIHTSVCAQV